MLFNSIEFSLFLPLVFLLYWFVLNKNLRVQNLLIVAASYLFYGWWDWRFLGLVAFSSIIDFLVGIQLGKAEKQLHRRLLLLTSVIVNLGFLGFFKYFNFFAESFAEAFTFFGSPMEPSRLNIILPVGISFYTFQTLSYSIDVYRRNLEPTKDAASFFAFVSFFPQLVAGPIERATNLLPQFYKPRSFDLQQAMDGMRQILWGLFKKIVIADNCAIYANKIFENTDWYGGSTLFMGAVFFSFQIYGDFSGYSDIAIGTSRLFGFKLKRNFAFPYFSRDIAEFWRRWHMSLSTWFRDYVYIPLGGSKGGLWPKIRNTFIIFIVSGFWHGANWTFMAWGLLNALYFLPLLLLKRNRRFTDSPAEGKLFASARELMQIGVTFFITVIAWVFFRAESITQALEYIRTIFSKSLISWPAVFPPMVIGLIALLIVVEWLQRTRQHGLDFTDTKIPRFWRWVIYYSIILVIWHFGAEQQDFIYFQF